MDYFEKFYNSALRFLSYRPRSEKEIRDRLRIRNQESGIKNLTLLIDQVIQKLKEYKFIDDVEFAKKWIESRLRLKPRSLRLIEMELKQKGISDEIIESGIKNQESRMGGDLTQAKRLAEKRIERLRGLAKQEIYQKLGRFLASKGFDWDIIKQSIDEVLKKRV